METIKPKVISLFAVSILIIFIATVISNNKNPLEIEDLQGKWKGKYKNYNISLIIYKDNICTLVSYQASQGKANEYSGECSIEIIKAPSSLKMLNIDELGTPLYSIFEIKSNSVIRMSSFSTKWRLRPVIMNKTNSFILNKDTYK